MLDTVVISGDDVCCSVVFGTLVGVCWCLVLCGPRCCVWWCMLGVGNGRGPGSGGVGWCYVYVSCESGLSV